MTAAETQLAQIRALCDGWSGDVDLADRIRAVLDAAPVAATPPQDDEHEPTWREKFFEVDALARQRRKQLEALRALHYESDCLMDGTDEVTCVTCDELWPCATIQVLDAPLVDATPPQGIDRFNLIELLGDCFPWALRDNHGRVIHGAADRILALVRPVEGITLTREEAALARRALVWSAEQQPLSLDHAAQQRALAARLEKEN